MKISHSTAFERRSSILCRILFLAGLILPSIGLDTAKAAAADSPGRQELLAQARRCREILRKSLIDFYLPACVDKDNGGYVESLRDGKFALTGEKFLTMQGRQLWFFSTIGGLQFRTASEAAKRLDCGRFIAAFVPV